MKKLISKWILIIGLIAFSNSLGQTASIHLTVFEPLPEVDFAAFAITNNLRGAPRIFQIDITPADMRVKVEVNVEWQKKEGESFQQLFHLVTADFSARTIDNTQIGTTDIRVNNSEVNSSLAEENIRKGKPTGVYRITLNLLDENGNFLDSDSRELSFLNPTQTLTIISPEPGSYQDIGNVTAQWQTVVGASSYKIKANVRRDPSQSLEDALDSGNPLINNRDVGNVTTVNLRQYLDREWLPGQEIVFQVTAEIPGPGGGSELFSDIANFFFNSSSENTNASDEVILSLVRILSNSNAGDIAGKLASGKIALEDIKFTDENGKILSRTELQSLLNYLESNPDAIANINFSAN